MYVVSRYGGRGRSIWTSIDNGTVEVRDRRNRVSIKVRDGIVLEETTRTKNKCTILRYGRDLTIKEGTKPLYQEFYEAGTLRRMKKRGLWKRQKDFPLCGAKGTLECYSTSCGSCGKEIFTYDNRKCAYVAARWRKKLVVYYPSGKLWMVLKGKVCVSQFPIAEQLEKKNSNFDIWRFMDGDDWDMTVYGLDGTTVVTQGHFANQQKQGKWLENSKVKYYMSGVKVSRSLYEEDPAAWNPHDVLRVPNAQLRCSLLNRMGYDKLLDKVDFRVIDGADDGGQLLEVKTGIGRKSESELDKKMRLIKVICPSTGQTYILRVPPDIEKFEQARQWTFGLQRAGIRDGVHLNFLKET